MSPKLSIYMPTYNRAHLLERAVASVRQLWERGVDLELVIGDNASTDNTPAVIADLSQRHPFIRAFRNSRNFGPIPNYLLCLRRTCGEFALYLADDDSLIVEEVLVILKTMEARPDLSMTVLTFQFWDDETGANSVWPNLPETLVIGRGDFAGAIPLFLNDIVLPEIVVMRRDIINRMFSERLGAYFAYVQFAYGLNHGNVLLYHRPAYRFHMTQQGTMDTVGWNMAVGSFEEHRAGLEYCLLQLQRLSPLGAAELQDYRLRIDKYIQRRMFHAAQRLVLRQEYQQAGLILQRLLIWDTDPDSKTRLQNILSEIAPSASAQSIVSLARDGFNAEYLAIHNDRDDPQFASISAMALASGKLKRIGLNEAVQQGVQAQTIVLAQREDLIPPTTAAGFPLPQILIPQQIMMEFTETLGY